MGPLEVPDGAYYGASSQRAVQNFPISGERFDRRFIWALGTIKYAAAIANRATHLITGDRRDFGAYFGKQLGGVLILPPRDYFESRRRKPRRPGKKR